MATVRTAQSHVNGSKARTKSRPPAAGRHNRNGAPAPADLPALAHRLTAAVLIETTDDEQGPECGGPRWPVSFTIDRRELYRTLPAVMRAVADLIDAGEVNPGKGLPGADRLRAVACLVEGYARCKALPGERDADDTYPAH